MFTNRSNYQRKTTACGQQLDLICFIDKVQEEIDKVVGQSRQPTMADRSNMPYTDAVVHEIQRMGNIVPLNALRMAARDTVLSGYFIPKVCLIIPPNTSAGSHI